MMDSLRHRVQQGAWPEQAWRQGWYLRGFLLWALEEPRALPKDGRIFPLWDHWWRTVLPAVLAELVLECPTLDSGSAWRVPPSPLSELE